MVSFKQVCAFLAVVSIAVAFIGYAELPVLAAFVFSGWFAIVSE